MCCKNERRAVVDRRIEEVTVFPSSMDMLVGDTACVYESIYPNNVTNRQVEWSSTDEDVASVDPFSGLVSAQKAGGAFIYATAKDGGGAKDRCVVSVHDVVLVTSIELYEHAITLCAGAEHELFATVFPHNATDKTVMWSSSNTSIADVDPYTGVVTAKRAGIATVYAMAQDGSGASAGCTVTVKRLRRNLRMRQKKKRRPFLLRQRQL